MPSKPAWTHDTIPAAIAGTLPGLFRERVRRSPNLSAYSFYDSNTHKWENICWKDLATKVALWQAAMEKEPLSCGDRVALMLPNQPSWVIFDQAALGLGLVIVPLYANDRPENIGYIIKDCQAKILLLPDVSYWRHLEVVRDRLDSIERIVVLDDSDELGMDARLITVSDWLPEFGGKLRCKESQAQELATIVYTSGTVGPPKGVMLSHRNILSNAYHSLQTIPVYREDRFLSFLPLSHMLERTAGYYLPMMAGASVTFARSITGLADDLLAIRPTILVTVPRIFERVRSTVITELHKRSQLARSLFLFMVETGWRRFQHQQKRSAWAPSLLLWPLLERLVARKLVARFGGCLRLTVCGGAALSPDVSKLFIGSGLVIVQGYGMTETSPVISVNPLEDNIPASVGTPLPGTDVAVAENDELLVQGPGVMLGYWRNEDATADMIDKHGWLHTGDTARVEDRHVYITGRIKDIIVLANGEKIAPADMETSIEAHPLLDQAMVIGEARPFLSTLLVLDPDHWHKCALQLGLNPDAPESLANESAHDYLLNIVSRQTTQFPGYARIHRIAPLLEPWTVENGLLTPTLKKKRNQISSRYSNLIDSLYEGH